MLEKIAQNIKNACSKEIRGACNLFPGKRVAFYLVTYVFFTDEKKYGVTASLVRE